ncbi:DnaJ domain-containing protein [Aquabacter sp. P-9]|uniref:DnaJ domain-containing protein n=1 Tax=Aquabacter sediminis TaxID=3029197 RepID=UPI00237DC230|nr:DnaJ domain-containing protein [Aquabacter sp. P-9]MDE1567218.1 DnaJ domain-containing protein [Aquabacter sp. P-9]
MALIAGAILLAVLLYAAHLWTKANPKALSLNLMKLGATLSFVAAAGMLVTGRFGAAIPLAAIGLALLGRTGGGLLGLFGSWFGGPRAPRVSKVRSAWFEMALDHDSGAMSGQILAGAHAGATLDALAVPDLLAMRAQVDAQSLALLEAYLDRRAPAWREDRQGNAGRGGGADPGRADGGPMTEEEAYEVLGLQPGADEATVRNAHRTLMKRLHPDQGGSGYLAARVNQAKDVILRKHR